MSATKERIACDRCRRFVRDEHDLYYVEDYGRGEDGMVCLRCRTAIERSADDFAGKRS